MRTKLLCARKTPANSTNNRLQRMMAYSEVVYCLHVYLGHIFLPSFDDKGLRGWCTGRLTYSGRIFWAVKDGLSNLWGLRDFSSTWGRNHLSSYEDFHSPCKVLSKMFTVTPSAPMWSIYQSLSSLEQLRSYCSSHFHAAQVYQIMTDRYRI